jgi:hypothetical protein
MCEMGMRVESYGKHMKGIFSRSYPCIGARRKMSYDVSKKVKRLALACQ